MYFVTSRQYWLGISQAQKYFQINHKPFKLVDFKPFYSTDFSADQLIDLFTNAFKQVYISIIAVAKGLISSPINVASCHTSYT